MPPARPSDLPAGDAPEDEGGDHTPAIPATAPLLGPDGTLLYTGSDGMQYIVCGEPDAAERARLLGAFEALRAGAGPLDELIKTSRTWRDAACARGLSREQATEVLLGRLRQALNDSPDPNDRSA